MEFPFKCKNGLGTRDGVSWSRGLNGMGQGWSRWPGASSVGYLAEREILEQEGRTLCC